MDQEKWMDRIGRGVEQATAVFDGAEITAVKADDGLVNIYRKGDLMSRFAAEFKRVRLIIFCKR
jgi:hypothetical protein